MTETETSTIKCAECGKDSGQTVPDGMAAFAPFGFILIDTGGNPLHAGFVMPEPTRIFPVGNIQVSVRCVECHGDVL